MTESPHEHFPLPEGAAELDEYVARFTAQHQLPESVTNAFAASTIPRFVVGLPQADAKYARHAVRARSWALEGFDMLWRQIYVEDVVAPGIDESLLSSGIAGMRAPILGRNLVLADVRKTSVNIINRTLQATRNQGLARSHELSALLPRVQFLYFPLSSPVWEPDQPLKNIPSEDTQSLGLPPEPSFSQLAAKMPAEARIDRSLETLAGRFETFLGVTNLELTKFILEDLGLFAGINFSTDQIRWGREFIRRHKEALGGEGLLGRQMALREFADVCTTQAARIRPGPNQRALRSLSIRLRQLDLNVDEFAQFFINTYTILGYDVPAVLLEQEEQPAVSAQAAAPLGRLVTPVPLPGPEEPSLVEPIPEPAAEAEPSPSVDPIVVEDIERRSQALHDEASAFEVWRMKSKAIRTQGFGQMERSLVEGFVDAARKQVLSPFIRDQARDIIGALVQLDRLGQTYEPAEARRRLEEAIQRRQGLQEAHGQLQEYALERGYTGHLVLPGMLDIRYYQQLLTENWKAFRQLIMATWPAGVPASAALRLEQLLQPPQ
jgi:hypothetical protein